MAPRDPGSQPGGGKFFLFINVCSVHLFVKQMWTWKCNNLDRPMVKNDDKNDDHDHEMSGFTFEILMSITSKYYQKFMPELLTAIHDR